ENEKKDKIRVILNGRELELPAREDGTDYQFFDLLAYTEIDTKKESGRLVQLLNGKSVSYTETLKDNDNAEIYWSEDN
ncbi:MAG: hypothetical protein GX683_00360, partial [Ruminococcaceae bacterium]|nr:hypothetical protein [Oscillospiraceae bacterium]